MEHSGEVIQDRSVPADEPMYEPPRVEVVVTATELEREALYAGGGIYPGGDAM